jgi:hypothetical protein
VNLFKRKPQEPEQEIDKTPWDRIVVHTEAGTQVKFDKNLYYYEVSGDTIYIKDVVSTKIVAMYPRFTGVNYTNVYVKFYGW